MYFSEEEEFSEYECEGCGSKSVRVPRLSPGGIFQTRGAGFGRLRRSEGVFDGDEILSDGGAVGAFS